MGPRGLAMGMGDGAADRDDDHRGSGESRAVVEKEAASGEYRQQPSVDTGPRRKCAAVARR